MCGIAGIVRISGQHQHGAGPTELVASMLAELHHRGPDDEGTWSDPTRGVALGNRRLAIVDVESTGHQPMVSPSGRHVLTFNGEIYNHELLRPELERLHYPFVGRSDTEVLLAAISEWGIDAALERANGMFAFAVWDRDAQQLLLVRDRIGEKPLYYGRTPFGFAFASELGAATAGSPTRPDIDRDTIAAYLRQSCVPAPLTIYRGFRQLPPATIACLDVGRGAREPTLRTYWSAADLVRGGSASADTFDEPSAIEEFDDLLRDAVALRMRSDVPLGAFLSGGIDSSLVVALMQAQTLGRVRTFTVGFEDDAYDESEWARRVGDRLGTEHTDMRMTSRDVLDVVPCIPAMFDEPFADPSALPTSMLAALAKRDVTVALSGDGGDELFGGYTRYVHCATRWRARQRDRRSARALLSRVRARRPGAARPISREEMYCQVRSFCRDPQAIVVGADEPPTLLTHPERAPEIDDYEAWMMHLDLVTYLPDYILTKVDRATMAHSLESRAPFLDHRVVELASALPSRAKIREGESKWILRRVLDRYLEPGLVDRPKAGFEPPLGDWLRTTLRDWAEPLLDASRLRAEGWFEPEPVRAWWREQLEGQDRTYPLWSVIVFQSWLEHHEA
jgi:asparagine synthase (glutamine-hydrolysing)